MTPREMRRVLVLGAAGNIGAHLATHLRGAGYEVLESDVRPGWRPGYQMADITQPLDLLPAFDWGPDVVYLCAALVGRMPSDQAGSLAVATNLAGINNVLQLCRRTGSRCVFFSSSEVYGPGCDPLDDRTSVPRPNNRYGLTKWLGEQLVEYEVRYAGLRAVTVRPCMFYHENETQGDHRSAMIRIATRLADGLPIEIHRGSARSWLHLDDAVHALEAAGRVTEYHTINIGHPEVIETERLAAMICERLKADPSLLRLVDLPAGMTLRKRPVLVLQRALLGFEPAISIDEGVGRVCAAQRQRLAHPLSGQIV